VVQLEELLEVRHSVFVVGNAGTGKTQVWKTLFRAYQNMKRKPVFNDLNPKAVTNDELFGIINPNTREWKDGGFVFCKVTVYFFLADKMLTFLYVLQHILSHHHYPHTRKIPMSPCLHPTLYHHTPWYSPLPMYFTAPTCYLQHF
jgi:Cdc6-like AAA superfamily ATPase